MKKCPKCGTILDDSKKKCYMCGADLLRGSITNFGDSFDDQIGATVTKSQDNVFNNVNNITSQINDVVSNNNDNMTFTQSSSTSNLYKNEMNGLNSLQYDDRSPLEKIFSNDSKMKSKDSINSNEAMQQNNNGFSNDFGAFTSNFGSKSSNVNTNFNNNMPNVQSSQNVQSLFGQQPSSQPTMTHPARKERQKPTINWGNNLKSSSDDVGGYKDKVSQGFNFKLNFSFIFNTVCFILFAIGLGYIYFTYIKKSDDGITNFGGLNYKMDEFFTLKSDESNSRYYTYGNNCAIRINYGTATSSTAVDDYFENVKATYEGQDGFETLKTDLQVNGNMWSDLSIIDIKTSGASYPKYRHTSIVYNGNIYDIIYANTDNNADCTAKYDSFVNSLTFD